MASSEEPGRELGLQRSKSFPTIPSYFPMKVKGMLTFAEDHQAAKLRKHRFPSSGYPVSCGEWDQDFTMVVINFPQPCQGVLTVICFTVILFRFWLCRVSFHLGKQDWCFVPAKISNKKPLALLCKGSKYWGWALTASLLNTLNGWPLKQGSPCAYLIQKDWGKSSLKL